MSLYSRIVTSTQPLRPESDHKFQKIYNIVFSENGKLSEETMAVMNALNISIKDIQNKSFEKFHLENPGEKKVILVRYNHF